MGPRTWLGLKKPKSHGRGHIQPLDNGTPQRVRSVEETIACRPDWIRRQVTDIEAAELAAEVIKQRATSIVEIGVAGGYSSAVLYSASASATPTPNLYAIDRERVCYHDENHLTGDAFYQIHGHAPGYSLTTGITSADLAFLPTVNFAFIDASHRHPWAALDLLSISRFLTPGSVVALHDLEIIFLPSARAKGLNGPRELFRAWQGEKWKSPKAGNVGFIKFSSDIMVRSLMNCLQTDWDIRLDDRTLGKFAAMCSSRRGTRPLRYLLIAKRTGRPRPH